jgi:hypothetical protein
MVYESSRTLLEQLDDRRTGRRAMQTLQRIDQDPTRVRPFQSIVDEMIEAGELDPKSPNGW